jgi:hypothetical protein
MTLLGIDVSHWQTRSDWSADGLSFLIARSSIGTSKDSAYDGHIAKAKAAGLVTGAYHFNYDGVSVATQVKAFLAAAGDVGLLALDVEGSHRFSLAQTKDFIARVHAAGKRIGLYMSESGFFEAGQDWDWVANWSREPTRHWDIWQFGSYLGEDGNRFAGTLGELRALAGQEADMQFEPTGTALGIATITATKTWLIGPNDSRIEVLAGLTRGVFSHVKLADGRAAYLVAYSGAAALLVADDRCTYAPTPVPVPEPDPALLEAAREDGYALGLADGAAGELQRIADAERARILGL